VCKDKKEIFSYYTLIEKKRDSLAYHIDGVVAAVNDNALFETLGIAGKSPRAVRALKFSGKLTTTRIVGVKFQVGRTGAITPVAVLAPVKLAGVTVSHASLHNADEIKRLGVKIGDTVVVERAGDVIPAVQKALSELRNGSEKAIHIPTHCPVCSVKLQRPKGQVILRCPNKGCLAQKQELLHHFVSKKAFNIVGLGPKIIDTLVKEHLISDASDIFELEHGDLASLERFAEKSVQNTVSAILQSKRIPLSRFIYALGIRHVGEETAYDLAHRFLSIKNLQRASLEKLEKVADVGEVVAQSVYDWFQNKGNKEFLKRLFKVGVQIQSTKNLGLKPGFSHKTFVLTGALISLSRDEAKERIRQAGGNVSELVSKKTDYVVVGENPGSKLKDARRLGIKTLTEKEFLRFMK